MRLLNIHSLTFQEFPDNDTPPYVITSHRWTGEEITYRQFCDRNVDTQITQTAGFKKVLSFCAFMRAWGKDLSCPSRHTSKPNSKGDCKHCFTRSFQCDQLKPKCSNCHHDSLPCEYDVPKAAEPTVESERDNDKERPLETRDPRSIESEPRTTAKSTSTKSCKACATANSICGKEIPSCSRCKEMNILCDYETALATSAASEKPEQITELQWIWIDTCCIDKGSSAELSETINSMFKWYQRAYACLAYLPDVRPQKYAPATVLLDFTKSSWFTRGWTLQELLAPRLVIFLNQDWEVFGHKAGPVQTSVELSAHKLQMPLNIWISKITGIKENILHDYKRIKDSPVSARLKWMKGRTTTRIEDRAYCLLGICDVFMPLIYGEGERACDRLEHAINTESTGMGKAVSGLRRRLMNQSSQGQEERSNMDNEKSTQNRPNYQSAPAGPVGVHFADIPPAPGPFANDYTLYPTPNNGDLWYDADSDLKKTKKNKQRRKNKKKLGKSKLETESNTLDRMLGGYSTTDDAEYLSDSRNDFVAFQPPLLPPQEFQDQFSQPYSGQQQPTAPFNPHMSIPQTTSTDPHPPSHLPQLPHAHASSVQANFGSTFEPPSVWFEPEDRSKRRRDRRTLDYNSSSTSSTSSDELSDRKHFQKTSSRLSRSRQLRSDSEDPIQFFPRRKGRHPNSRVNRPGDKYDAFRQLEDQVDRLNAKLKKAQDLNGGPNGCISKNPTVRCCEPVTSISQTGRPNVLHSSNQRSTQSHALNDGLSQRPTEAGHCCCHPSLNGVTQAVGCAHGPHPTLPNYLPYGSLSGRCYLASWPPPNYCPPFSMFSFYPPWYSTGPWNLSIQAYPRPYEQIYAP